MTLRKSKKTGRTAGTGQLPKTYGVNRLSYIADQILFHICGAVIDAYWSSMRFINRQFS